jgi:phosphatidylglycerol---prolipoprotein diacylglyceryl transferase
MAIKFPDINPVILQIGDTPFKITWYSLAYVLGMIIGFYYIKKINKNSPDQIGKEIFDDILTYIILGVVLGGRLGYVLFYDLEYNLANPINIFKTWQGGMSFHGGLMGVIFASYLICKKHKLNYLTITDLLASATPIGLFFGRIANFINAELYGRVTQSKWGVIFPGQHLARHASQLYEAFFEGLVLFSILFYLQRYTRSLHYHGLISGVFLSFYGLIRMGIENFREPDSHLGFIFLNITMGQILCLPMILMGVGLMIFSIKNKTHENT